MSRPEHLSTPNTAEGIRRINEMQENYDRDPEEYERREKERKDEAEAEAQHEAEMNAQGEAEAEMQAAEADAAQADAEATLANAKPQEQPELSKSQKGECKNAECRNPRRDGSAYCQACSDNYHQSQ